MKSVGETAPTFTLPGMTADAEDVELYAVDDSLDSPVILAFYLFDFHPACTEQLCDLHDLDWFDIDLSVTVYGISTDGAFSHREFARDQGISVPLLSDHDGSVASDYGVLRESVNHHANVPNRSVFVVDTDRTIQYAWAADEPPAQPPWDEVRSAVSAIESA